MLKCIYSKVPLLRLTHVKTDNFQSQKQPIFGHKTSQSSATKPANFQPQKQPILSYWYTNRQFSVTKTVNFQSQKQPIFMHLDLVI